MIPVLILVGLVLCAYGLGYQRGKAVGQRAEIIWVKDFLGWCEEQR